jgi:hypothetical protein
MFVPPSTSLTRSIVWVKYGHALFAMTARRIDEFATGVPRLPRALLERAKVPDVDAVSGCRAVSIDPAARVGGEVTESAHS